MFLAAHSRIWTISGRMPCAFCPPMATVRSSLLYRNNFRTAYTIPIPEKAVRAKVRRYMRIVARQYSPFGIGEQGSEVQFSARIHLKIISDTNQWRILCNFSLFSDYPSYRVVQFVSIQATYNDSKQLGEDARSTGKSLHRFATRILGAALLTASVAFTNPVYAELQTVPAEQMTSMAKPLKEQPVNKGKIWLLFILGASSLFGATVLLENNEAWFPAISKANRAMKTARARAEAAQREEEAEKQRLQLVEQERAQDSMLENAVLAGIEEARVVNKLKDAEDGMEAEPESRTGFAGELSSTESAAQERGDALDDSDREYSSDASVYPHDVDASERKNEERGLGEAVTAHDEREDAALETEAATAEEEDSPRDAVSPLYEISTEEIEASLRQKRQETLQNVSLDQLQKELDARKASSS